MVYVSGVHQGPLIIGGGNAAVVAAITCCWQGARAFERRPPLWSALLALPLAWLGAAAFQPSTAT
jgi:hypothetical protein